MLKTPHRVRDLARCGTDEIRVRVTYITTRPALARADEVAEAVGGLPAVAPPTDKRARRIVREQRQRGLTQQIAALRDEGKTWDEVAAVVGLSPSRVRDLYALQMGAADRPDDTAILDNLSAFLLANPATISRRAYVQWPGRLVAATTIENRFGSWARAIALVSDTDNTRPMSA